MVVIHNLFIRIMNTIYLQCEGVSARGTAADKADFAEYALLWGESIAHHHHTEETMVFSQIETICGAPGIMQTNRDQHDAFHPGLDEYTAYLKGVVAGSDEYDGARLRRIIDGFMPVLTEHLHDEIETLKGLRAHEDKTDWGKFTEELVAEIMKKAAEEEGFEVRW
jgi:hypothetical protein